MTRIATEFDFCSAHFLPNVPDTHKCKRLHGHNYKLRVILDGPLEDRTGMVIDFFDIDKVVLPMVSTLDHYELNKISGLENPTAEIIAQWFALRIANVLGRKVTCRIYETPACWAEAVGSP